VLLAVGAGVLSAGICVAPDFAESKSKSTNLIVTDRCGRQCHWWRALFAVRESLLKLLVSTRRSYADYP
jgi:hypothetical protein